MLLLNHLNGNLGLRLDMLCELDLAKLALAKILLYIN
jgi:hypothetical protein